MAGGWKESTISPTKEEWEEVIDKLQNEFAGDLVVAGYGKAEITKLQWAFSEAIYNKVKHGNGFSSKKKTNVKWKVDRQGVTIKVSDHGRKFNYEKALDDAEKKENRYTSVALLDSWAPMNCGAGLAITLRNLGRRSISYDEGGKEVSLKYKKPKQPLDVILVS
ncbi:MAG: ATP-binding protein [Candidatus Micrarchaeota archaeon]